MNESSSLEPSIALSAYTEPLANNRRVLVFGSALAALPFQLLERGARSVHICDSDAARVAEASARNRSTQIVFSSLADSDLALRDGAFDLALIDNLSRFEPTSVLRTAKRAIGSRGVLAVACPNPEALFPLVQSDAQPSTSLDYYALYDAVAAEFEYVRMLGQTPFVGYAIADFSASGEPEPVLDTSFVPGGAEEPDAFIALASGHDVRLEEFSVIQLPTRRLLGALSAGSAPAKDAEAEKAHGAEIGRLNQWIEELESRASTADERADHTEAELEELRPKLDAERQASGALEARHTKQLSAVQGELNAARSELSAARGELSAAQGELSAAQGELSTARGELSELRAERNRLREEANTLRAELSAKGSDVTRLAAELSSVKAELAARDQRLVEQASKLEEASAKEIAQFEQTLAERGGEIRRLEQDLRTAERTGRELVRELERRQNESRSSAAAEVERALAEREADLQAAAWTIESLTLRLEMAGKSAEPDPAAPVPENAHQEAR